ncbi:Hypothetical protein R9X50_00608700 [Acrodontium crateriforme]|uniref:FAD-binding FR-type domain-containing protein n=1 Tax=Acrodontium crateriforme TaxID=150365 RepID=A0AAQ3RBZ2_9PEZI|nr:Hypothetical protein R9X50_00608700 [Acrodontium crateriforme]
MALSHDEKPSSRRHSFSSFGARHHRHQPIPTSESSHPDNHIPTEPVGGGELRMSSPSKLQKMSCALSTSASSPRSSGDSIAVYAVDDDTSDSTDAASLTPLSEPQEMGEWTDKIEDLPQLNPERSRPRRASTTFVSNAEDIKRILGDGFGTKFVQKMCCGGGCCMLEAMPTHSAKPGFKAVSRPDNDAFRFLNLNLGALALDTCLTKTVELPEQKATFEPVRRQSITEKFPLETRHEHTENAINAYPPTYMKPHPPYDIFSAPVYGARELTKPGAEKRTFHFDIDVTDYPEEGGVDFKVGGAVGVCPPSDPAVVEDILNQLGVPRFQRDKPVRLCTTGGRWPTIWGEEEARELVTTRREILTWTVDISSTAPTKPLFRLLAEHAEEPNEKQILLFLCSAQGQAAFCDLRTGPHITLQQLLHAFPSSKPPVEALCGVLTQLMPRFYSLSNDPHISSAREGLADRRLIEVAVTIHTTPAYDGQRSGVGSGFLERIASKFIEAEQKAEAEAKATSAVYQTGVAGRALDLRIPMFRGLMANPLSREFASNGPMVLIGAGVGMAPFRGFILNRLKNAQCANKIWLIQGIRDRKYDELYVGELGEHEGDIKRVVQSRVTEPVKAMEVETPVSGSDTEQNAPEISEKKVSKYVQDELRQQADVVWFAINAIDGRIFVCGSTKGMGEGVESALIDIAMDKGPMDLETARQFWVNKREQGQYIAETW